jgi:hypothetical protein
MSDQRFKTIRHIETVRNYLNEVIRELLSRAELHDQSKLQNPEREMFDEWTEKLRGVTYESEEYKGFLKEMSKTALKHHYEHNRHHPEHFENGINAMDLIDVIEMFCDWYSATKRHNDGDIYRSIALNKESKLKNSDVLEAIFKNTANWITKKDVFHHAEES